MAYWIFKALLSPLFFLFWRVRVEGREHVPAHGAVVLAANHQSFCDSFFLPLVLRRRVTFLAKAEYFDSWKTAWFFRAAGQIPINREGGDRSQRALDTAIRVLGEGRVLAIYPEGTRSPDPRLHRGRTGVARLSLTCGVPLVPVGIAGTRDIQPPGSMVLRPFRRVTVRFGPPLASPGARHGAAGPGPGAASAAADPAELRAMTDALMAEIARLSGQEYVDEYARRSRADEGAAPTAPATPAVPAPAASATPAVPAPAAPATHHHSGAPSLTPGSPVPTAGRAPAHGGERKA